MMHGPINIRPLCSFVLGCTNGWKCENAGGGSVAASDVEGVDLCNNLVQP